MSILTPGRTADPTAATMDGEASRIAAASMRDRIGERRPTQPKPPAGWLGVPMRAWWMAGLLLALFVATYRMNLLRLWLKTNPINGTEEWPHAIFVPIVGLYFLFLNLDELLKVPVRPLLGADLTRNRFISAGVTMLIGAVCWKLLPFLPGPFRTYSAYIDALGVGIILLGAFALVFDWGMGTLLAGLATFAYGIYPGRNDFVKDVGMVMSVFGMVLTLCGWRVMRIAWFPCIFLFFALPWPGLFYQQVAGPMQRLAAQVAVGVMSLCGVDVENEGVKIIFQHRNGIADLPPLNVAEACAGIKSLMTFVSLGASIAFLSSRPLWQKLLITASGVPIAIGCNVMRVTGQGLLHFYVGTEWSSGFAHQFAGIVLLLPGFLFLLAIVWVLDVLFVEEDETVTKNVVAPAASPSTAKPASGGGVA